MEKWPTIVQTLGVSVAALVFIAWFVVYRVWPFYCKQVEANATARAAQITDFLSALEHRDEKFGEIVDALGELREEIKTRRK